MTKTMNTERMTDERFAEWETSDECGELTWGEDKPNSVAELWFALAAEREHLSELTAALPKWTEAMYGESSTFPEEDQEIMVYCCGNHEAGRFPDEVTVLSSDWWRPLCDLDYPPEES